jgi:NAD+ synthase (glutamine-hydrolysing)
MLQNRVRDAKCPILYVNRVGLENNTKNLILYDGDSALIGADGEFKWRGPQHEAGVFTFDFTEDMPSLEGNHHKSGAEEHHTALIVAIREFLGAFPKVVIGLSGGIDSAVSAALLVEALGKDKVLAVNMPTVFNSQTTQKLARQCAQSLGIEYRVVSIQALVDAQVKALTDAGFSRPDKKTLENIQARIRGAGVQAALAQMYGGVFINNGNKTEVALNYFTLYGDGAGVACFLADLWKGQIYELAAYINKKSGRDAIPQGIINVIPSAELSEDHNIDQGKGDPIHFPYHDKLLLAFTEKRWDPTLVMGHMILGDLEEVLGCRSGVIKEYFKNRRHFVENLEWAWRQYNVEFKRGQTPPVFLMSRRAFGFDRRDTIAGAYFTDEYEILKASYVELQDL